MLAKLSSFYFFYFALLGVMVPYLGLFLESKGFDLLEISQLTSVLMITKVIAPNVWGVVADHSQKRLSLVRVGAFCTLFSYLGFFFAESFWEYLLVIVSFSFFWKAILPQFEVITLHALGQARESYSRIRLWGSVGFILAVVLVGYLFEQFDLELFPAVMLIIITCIALSSTMRFGEPHVELAAKGVRDSFTRQLMQPAILVFFLTCLLLHLSHGAYYTYYSIYLETFGHSKAYIGLLWSLGVVAEVILFIYMHRWLKCSSVVSIMFVSLALTALRWWLIAWYADNEAILIFAQLLHALSFGAMHAAAIHFVHKSFERQFQGRAQALYSSFGFGLGGAIGALLSGYLVDLSGYSTAFLVSSLLAVGACVLVFCARNHLLKPSVTN